MDPFSFVDQPAVQFGLTFLTGLSLKRWPAFKTRGVPIALFGLSMLVSLLGTMLGSQVENREVTSAMLDAVANWVAVIGTHSGAKNTWQWYREGMSFTK